jgi:hypothetical protein
MKVSVKKLVTLSLLLVSVGASAFAKEPTKICGVVSQDRDGGFSLVDNQKNSWEISPKNRAVAQELEDAAAPLYIPTAGAAKYRNVCLKGRVLLDDEDKGLVFRADAVEN